MDPLIDPASAYLTTPRLTLRGWTEPDEEALAALSADPETMLFFDSLPGREHIGQLVARSQAALAAGQPGHFAVQRREDARFIGFVGLGVPRFEAAFLPCVEIGWRLAREFWGHGYATEAGHAVLRHAFETLRLAEVVSFTAVLNEPSQAVMRRLGMRHDPREDFEHPMIPPGHPIRPHVLYRLTREEWAAANTGTRFDP